MCSDLSLSTNLKSTSARDTVFFLPHSLFKVVTLFCQALSCRYFSVDLQPTQWVRQNWFSVPYHHGHSFSEVHSNRSCRALILTFLQCYQLSCKLSNHQYQPVGGDGLFRSLHLCREDFHSTTLFPVFGICPANSLPDGYNPTAD